MGYDGILTPDHVHAIEGLGSESGFVFAFAYIMALIAAVRRGLRVRLDPS